MAEYYPLLAKAVGSLPNSTLESRRLVYERARKALIGQLRTLHPPVPDDDIERESIELDRAVERLESELASGRLPGPAAPPVAPPPPRMAPPPPRPAPLKPLPPRPAPGQPPSGPLPAGSVPAIASARPAPSLPESPGGTPAVLLRARTPDAEGKTPDAEGRTPDADALPSGAPSPAAGLPDAIGQAAPQISAGPQALDAAPAGEGLRPRSERPIAPQPPASEGNRRPVWIIPVGIGLIVAAVAVAAYELRDKRPSGARVKPAEQTAQGDSGKIAERVGAPTSDEANGVPAERRPKPAVPGETAAVPTTPEAAPSNPELPVAQRAALLVEAPDEPNKVKTFLGSVVWKLNNLNAGPGEGVSLAVEADVDLPDDRMKAVVTFEKNSDPSLPASHTIKVRFSMQPGSVSGDVQQISVPQLRQEDSPSGEALAGVTVPVVQNSFLVGLSPGNAETVNIKQLKEMQWIDVPMLLSNGKIAKLTFEKGTPGERDLNDAITAWQKS